MTDYQTLMSWQVRQVRVLVGLGSASSALSSCSSKFHLIGTPLRQTSVSLINFLKFSV